VARRARKIVLISEPQTFRQSRYLPYVWAVLKSHCDRVPDLMDRIEWLDPIHNRAEPEECLAPYRERTPDVLGLSCYTWNWELQCRIAERVKQRNPRCVVVAGGPHPDYTNPRFFRNHPFIDIVAVRDGEFTFTRILSKVVSGDDDFSDIGGLHLPVGRGEAAFSTGPAEVPTTFESSPYLAQSAYFEQFMRSQQGANVDAIWETNRGCPYSCSFCDWGSSTMSKVRPFDLGRLEAEIDWFARKHLNSLLLADANFGILPRDVEIAGLLNKARAKYGFPRFVHYSPAKNNPERTLEIARLFSASGICPVHTFALQHTDADVVAASDRANISVARQRTIANAVIAQNIPTVVQLILGMPGDTYDRWKTCLTDLMDWGLHDNYQIFDYALLPNAPAADRAYMDRWAIETITRDIPKEGTGQRHRDDTDALTRVPIVIKSKTFSQDDWVRMKTYAAFVRALHNFGLTRLIGLYLHFTHAVPYREFYDALIENHFGRTSVYRSLIEHLRRFLADPNTPEDLVWDRFPELGLSLEASRWAFVELCLEIDLCFDEMTAFLIARFATATNLMSVIDYQRHVLVLPGGRVRAGRTFGTSHDWVSYFDKARRLTSYEPMGEPAATPGALVRIDDPRIEDLSGPADERSRWMAWMGRSHEVRRTMGGHFSELRLQRSLD
jgi:putative methyltransferase